MLNNIYTALERLGLTAQKRALHIQFSNPIIGAQVLLQRIDGSHEINGESRAELICLSTSHSIALKNFIGLRVAVDQLSDTGIFRTTGLITAASVGASDGALTVYKLTMQDATALWSKRRNSRVFLNKSVPQILEVLFKEWQQRSPLFAASLTLDKSGLSRDYDVRPFIMQVSENDHEFLTRLLRSEGINWLIDEVQPNVSGFRDPLQPQRFRLIDDNSQYQSLPRRSIRYHPESSAVQAADSITSLISARRLQSTAVHIQRWQADVLQQEEGAGSVLSPHQHSSQYDTASLGLEDAWGVSPAWISDLNAEDGTTASGNAQIERLNDQLKAYHNQEAKNFSADSTVRNAQVGYYFVLMDHPEINESAGSDCELLITSKHYFNQNNLPKDLSDQLNQLLMRSNWQIPQLEATEQRQGNRLTLQRRSIPLQPEYNPLRHRPQTHAMIGRVVGPTGEEIYTDEWGRVKVRFLFTRDEDHAHDGGAGANDNDTDSAWVDVLTPWAGEGYGARFLPRVGELIAIDFFGGDPDRPFIMGRLHQGQRSPSKFDNKGQLPETRRLSGIRSREIGAEGYNQLRLDDTPGQISAQLQSSHAATQLNLGNLSHPKETEESGGRGEGFELRTDQWGAVRAGEGLLISSHPQARAQGHHLDAAEAKSQLDASLNSAKALSEVAKNQQTDPLEVLDNLKAFLEQIEQQDQGKAKAFKQALMILTSPNSIALSSNEDIHVSAQGQISQTAGDSINLSTQKSLIGHAREKISAFAAQGGISAIAGQGKVEMVAQNDVLDVIARKQLQIISTEDTVYITSPKEIVLKTEGAELRLNGSGVSVTTPFPFVVNAGQHIFKGGAKVDMSQRTFNTSPCYLTYKANDLSGQPIANKKYVMLLEDGSVIKGVTDNQGKTQRIQTEGPQKVSVYIDDPNVKGFTLDIEG
ncbi:type VI secretion system Vgr family protein [Acinetobacter gyllenbergii]|uniref:type VI secretion system Vgr family protein n=1 Tax=Acinetobacter gyllenbergii TaxID=134534 RepID=UPI000806949D|nr:type VI secretion system Vgr family protein [Acinetobacter gyllenbergii]OBY74358.1 VGR protein [Acinetobacter gyllenbergii]